MIQDMHYLRYSGQFLSRKNITWQVNIYQKADEEFTSIGMLTFPADEPLTIEWENADKTQVICGSTATLQIESPGDRTYEDLYTIEVGSIRMDVLREGILYWSGMLDPEFYEEPYELEANYTVSLTFSDFGILDRLTYNLAGMHTLRQIIDYCIQRSGINLTGMDETLISTSIDADGRSLTLSDLQVRSDNFYDEDGEALTLREVMEGILCPLALRMVQRTGQLFIYDLNGLYSHGTIRQISWSGNSSTLGVDNVYNNAQIIWSTYAQSGNLSPSDCWTEKTDSGAISINSLSGTAYGKSILYSYHYSTELTDWIDATDCGFTLWTSREGKGATLLSDDIRFFKIVPQYDGNEAEGVAIYWTSVRGYKSGTGSNWNEAMGSTPHGVPYNLLAGTLATISKALFKSSEIWIPPVDNADKLLLRITIEMLMDPRFNPHESAVNWNIATQKDWEEEWNLRGNFVYMPVTIKFRPTDSNKIYCWTNRMIVSSSITFPAKTLNRTYGQWMEYDTGNEETPNVWGYLCYYNSDDRAERTGVVGWKKNRPAINPHTEKMISILTNAEDGQYIPYPTFGGRGGNLWMEVRSKGWMISDGKVNLSSKEIMNPFNLWSKYSWLLLKLPEIEIMNNQQFEQTIDTNDVEYKAELNSNAKEGIEIETICGTSKEGVPTARGAYFVTSTGRQITELTRAGRTTQAEELLIGTLYSQYAQRHTKLSGEVDLHVGGIETYTEANQGDKKFIVTAEVQNVIMDVNEAIFVELRPDEYIKKEE